MTVTVLVSYGVNYAEGRNDLVLTSWALKRKYLAKQRKMIVHTTTNTSTVKGVTSRITDPRQGQQLSLINALHDIPVPRSNRDRTFLVRARGYARARGTRCRDHSIHK